MQTTIPFNTHSLSHGILTNRTYFQTFAVVICLTGMAILLALILQSTGGALNYTLDDPYIHLALAENLVQGHYGVNVDENASPSSSILYPFLLAASLAIGFGQWAPLALNVIGTVGAGWILSGLFWDALHKSDTGHVSWVALMTLPFLLLAMSGFALGFTGMEHTLHVWVSLAIVRGLIVMGQTKAVPLFLLVACIATPLLRFEGAALSGAALLAICLTGHWRAGLTTGTILAGCFAVYVTTMLSLGLPPMPSSVMVKSGSTAALVANRIDAVGIEILLNLRASLANRQGGILAGLVVIALLRCPWAKPQERTVAFVAAAAGIAHLLVGRWDWFFRYEVYIIATLIAANLYLWTPILNTQNRRITTPGLLFLILPFISYNYLLGAILTPPAARNIYEQQFQMHRFATDYFPERVAVIDLGWVTYDNDQYVLDLWGLGSETARQLYQNVGRTPEPIRTLTENANVSYAMLYDEVFYEGLPEEWCLIGQLETPQVTASFATVEFFLIVPDEETRMRDAMDAFATSLPERVSLHTFDC